MKDIKEQASQILTNHSWTNAGRIGEQRKWIVESMIDFAQQYHQEQLQETPFILSEAFADNGEHSHWRLINKETGENIWSEDPEEDKALGFPVKSQLSKLPSDEEIEKEFPINSNKEEWTPVLHMKNLINENRQEGAKWMRDKANNL